MKKSVILALVLSFLSFNVFAAEPVGSDAEREAHRQEMKAIKDAQRAARQNKPQAVKDKNVAPGFWEKEGERSGLGRMGHVGNVLQNLNPMPFFKTQDEQYKARKAAAQTK